MHYPTYLVHQFLLRPYSSSLLLAFLIFAIHLLSLCSVSCRFLHLTWKPCVLQWGLQAIAYCPAMISTSCCELPILSQASSIRGTPVDIDSIGCIAPVLNIIASSFAITKRLNVRKIFGHFCNALMGRHGSDRALQLLSSVACLVTSIWLIGLSIGERMQFWSLSASSGPVNVFWLS